MLVLLQAILQPAPHVTWQFGPLVQLKVHWSAQVASQLPPKLEHVGAQGVAPPQFSEQSLPPLQLHDDPEHCGPLACEEHATTSATRTAARDTTDCRRMPLQLYSGKTSMPAERFHS